MNYVTKSGANRFHGNAEYFWNGSVLNATDWITKAFGNPRPFDIANQWAGSLGGPIKKNRLFFFFDTEGIRVLLPSPVQIVLRAHSSRRRPSPISIRSLALHPLPMLSTSKSSVCITKPLE